MKWVDSALFALLAAAIFIPVFLGDTYTGPDAWTLWTQVGIPALILRYTLLNYIVNRRLLDRNRSRLSAITGRKLYRDATWFVAGDLDLLKGFDRGFFGVMIVRKRGLLTLLVAFISFFLPGYYFLGVPVLLQALAPYRPYLNPAYLSDSCLIGWSAGTAAAFLLIYFLRRTRVVTPA